MPAWAWAALVWAVSLPLAFRFARRQGFLTGDDPIIVFRVPIVAFVAPALALVSVGAWLLERSDRGSGPAG